MYATVSCPCPSILCYDQKSRDRALAFLDNNMSDFDSNPHTVIGNMLRSQINNMNDGVAELKKLCADLEHVCSSIYTIYYCCVCFFYVLWLCVCF